MAKWPRDTGTYANQSADNFKRRLKSVAENFADHERVDSVSKKHVDDSFFALARIGLQSPEWYQRSDTWTAVGAFLIGTSFSMPDLCAVLFSDEKYQSICSIVFWIFLLAGGLGILIWAKMAGSLPRKKR